MKTATIHKSKIDCDYLIVGTGAGGSIAGYHLAKNGKDVLFLEEGSNLRISTLNQKISFLTNQFYRKGGLTPIFGKPMIAFTEGKCVGGSTVINGGLFWRTPPWVIDDWCKKYGLTDFNLTNLDKHFDQIEKMLHVELVQNSTNSNQDSQFILNAAQTLKWKTVPVPRAVKNCQNSNFCPTGCPIEAKQSVNLNYIPQAINYGARLIADTKAIRILHRNNIAYQMIAQSQNQHQKIHINFKKLILAAGAIHTPHLIQKSGLKTPPIGKIQFHLNLKIAARFKTPVDAENGTIFTIQVQEFQREGILIMASTMKPHYLALNLTHQHPTVIKQWYQNYQATALYTTMIQSQSVAKIYSSFGAEPLILNSFNPKDLYKIKKGLIKSVELLFAANALEIILPIKGFPPITSLQQLTSIINQIKPHQLDLVSVHVMSSCPMGTNPQYTAVDINGKFHHTKNIYCTDASILPTNIGESPQGTIMAFSSKITENIIQLS